MNFKLGYVSIEEDVHKAVSLDLIFFYLERHQKGDFGDVEETTELLNYFSISNERLIVQSRYHIDDNITVAVDTSFEHNATLVSLVN